MLSVRMLRAAASGDVGWTGFKKIPIAYGVQGTHSDFPVYLKPSAVAGLGGLTLAQAQSARFYSDQAKTNELAREIVSADEIHVKVPSFSASSALYMDVDGQRPDYAVTDPKGAQAVWNSNYVFMLHKGAGNDSTSNNNDAAARNGVNVGSADGAINKATFYDGVDDFAELSDLSSFVDGTSDFSMGCIVAAHRYPPDTTSANADEILCFNGSSRLFLHQGDKAPPDAFSVRAQLQSSSWTTLVHTGHIELDTFYEIDVVFDTTSGWHLYLDGEEVATNSNTETISGQGSDSAICSIGQLGDGSRYGNITVDAAYLRSNALDANYITAKHVNQSDPASFFGTATDA